MKFHVAREACCSQDDQLGPLSATYDLDAGATLQDLADTVLRSNFLQFTSTHSVMAGRVEGEAVVRVFGPEGSFRKPQYLKPPNALAKDVVGGSALNFRFVFD